ncbi:glycosyltransferase [Roseibacterium sp. SDUM158017]|uniref:glycosyltransferase n=1 Tax=Roseicyclus salinarum TaxID=3036773 RepID=UPI002414E42F|nr:glycosyltransferase [Roseibacterium sp. SDUM158017]MDG4647142.1 glycosyltransferase [Roseibacterium sp. SDUM158017]
MADESPGTIISLTYHEITADPRVLKEARALARAGYDVHIFCDWPEGKPQHDEIDGIRVTRFSCFGTDGISLAAFEAMDFLTSSRPAIADRYVPYASACEFLTGIRPHLNERFGSDSFDRLKSSYFRKHKGVKKLKRFVSYLSFHLSLRQFDAKSPREEGASVKKMSLSAALADWRKHRGRQFQAQSIAFWSNLSNEKFDGQYAAVHAHDIYCLPAGVMLARQLNVPLVYDAHEYEPARATKIASDAPQLPELIENDCFAHIDRMITVSEGIAELYAQRYQGPAPTIVMNAPETDAHGALKKGDLPADFRTVRDQVGLADDQPLVVATGAVQRAHRGMDKVLEALVHLPDVNLASLGPRHAANDNWFMGVARKLGVSSRVHLLPPVDAKHVPAAINSANASICAFQDVSLNHRLAMPNKLFEAAFARIPICVSDLPEMRRFVETLEIGRVMDQTCPESIAAALRDVIQNPENYRPNSETDRKLAEVYSWPRQAEKLIGLYQDLFGAPSSYDESIRSTIRAEAEPSP